MKRLRALAFPVAFGMGFALAMAPQRASSDTGPAVDCFSEDIERRIEGCTALIERGDQTLADMSHVYAMRALAYSLKGRYDAAIRAAASRDHAAAVRSSCRSAACIRLRRRGSH